MNTSLPLRARAALATLVMIAPASVAACDEAQREENEAANAVELARYLPQDTKLAQTVDVAEARDELKLPDDSNALPTSKGELPRPRSPEAQLFEVTSGPYPDVAEAFATVGNARRATPLDGTLVRAAAGGSQGVSIVSTSEPIEDIERKLKLAGYALRKRVYEFKERGEMPASRLVAYAGAGRIVFADRKRDIREALRRAARDADPGRAAKALEPAAGSVRLAMVNDRKRSCVTAFAAAMEGTGEGAALALIVEGEKPQPERFNPRGLEGLATGTPTVLIDALLVPIRVKKPLKDGIDAVSQVARQDPVRSYNCP